MANRIEVLNKDLGDDWRGTAWLVKDVPTGAHFVVSFGPPLEPGEADYAEWLVGNEDYVGETAVVPAHPDGTVHLEAFITFCGGRPFVVLPGAEPQHEEAIAELERQIAVVAEQDPSLR